MPKIVDHEERRSAIAIGVITVMAGGGIGRVSLRSVAQAAGVSMGSVQHYFATKADLVRHACQMFIDRATQQHIDTAGSPAAERIRILLTMNIPDTPEQRTGTKIWHEFVLAGAADTAIAEMITRAWQRRRSILVDLLGSIRFEDGRSPGEIADLLAATSDGFALHATLGQITHEMADSRLRTQLDELGIVG